LLQWDGIHSNLLDVSAAQAIPFAPCLG
jgi:hypothetical protein